MTMKCLFDGTGGGSSRVEDPSPVTREGILREARRVFARDGFEAARLENIAREAGLAPEEVLELFNSKTELFMSVRQQFADEWIGILERLLETCDWGVERTRKTLRNQISQLIEPPQARALLVEFQRFASRCSESFNWYSSFKRQQERSSPSSESLRDDPGGRSRGERSEKFVRWFVIDLLFEPRMIDLLHADGLSVILLDTLRKNGASAST
jgi:AcrR family transcriptional regulator